MPCNGCWRGGRARTEWADEGAGDLGQVGVLGE